MGGRTLRRFSVDSLTCKLESQACADSLNIGIQNGMKRQRVVIGALILGTMCLVCSAATVQMGRILGLELRPHMYIMPAFVGGMFGSILGAVYVFWNRSQVAKREAETANSELSRVNGQLQSLNSELEEVVEERSRVIISQAEQLQASRQSMMLGLLAGGVAHDVNNLLAIIQLSLFALESSDDEAIREVATDISDACERGASLVDRLMLTTNRNVEAVVLNISDTLQGLSPLLKAGVRSNHELIMSLQPSGSVRMDASALDQIILNLVTNARDAIGEAGGTIEVGCKARSRDTGESVVLWVKDTGPGIPEAFAERVFEPFVTGKESGTGLGLASVQELVQQCRGTIEFETSPHGTVFWVTLPVVGANDSIAGEAEAIFQGPTRPLSGRLETLT